jgi:hypothetical protein
VFTVQTKEKNFTETKNNMLYCLEKYCNRSIKDRKKGGGGILRLVETMVQWRSLVNLIMIFEYLYKARFIKINRDVYITVSVKTFFIYFC